ncbi:MAG: polyprenyl synthetase family protein [Myxococcales bacterium]|nr:polyprenyl synthetase family protein [Myxococcales bacterium]
MSTPSQVAPVTLAAIQRPVRAELDAAFAELGRIVRSDFPLIEAVNAHLLRIKGKMFRPTLLLLSAKAVERMGPSKTALAAAVELIHVATLVHDDSVDHSVLRRGQPTVNARFSHQIAVIMGDYLYSRAIIELVNQPDPEALRVMSRVTNDMTVGEMRELEAYDALDYSMDAYTALIRAKTASLMSGACEVGAVGAPPAQRVALRDYGTHLGMAFQITDDVLDYTETERVTGKPSGLDLKEHKITLPLIAGLPHMSAAERQRVSAVMADPEPTDETVADVIGIVHARGGVSAARAQAAAYAERAAAALAVVSEGEARDALGDCITYAVERRS